MKKICMLIAAAACFGFFRPAFALDEIYSPNVVPGEFSVEYAGSRTFDNDGSKNNIQDHELAVEYGVNDHLLVEAAAGYSKEPGESLTLEEAELQARYQFAEQGKYWADTGLLMAFIASTHDEDPHALEAKLLL